MPSRNGLDAGKSLLGQNKQTNPFSTYQVAAQTAKEVKRLKNDEAHAEFLVKDYYRGHAKKPEVR